MCVFHTKPKQKKEIVKWFSIHLTRVMGVEQALPFHGTIVQREFAHIAFALLFSRRSDCDKHTCW